MQSCRTLDWLSLKTFRKNVLLPRFQKQIIKKNLSILVLNSGLSHVLSNNDNPRST